MKTLSKITLVSFLALFALACDPGIIDPGDPPPDQEEVCDPGLDECVGEIIYIVEQCEGAFGRFYTFSDFLVTVETGQ